MTNSEVVVIAIDDEDFYLDEISIDCNTLGFTFYPFKGANDFEEKITPEILSSADIILVDFDLNNCTALEIDIVGFIKNKCKSFNGKIGIVSLHKNFGSDYQTIRNTYDFIVQKRDLNQDFLQQAVC